MSIKENYSITIGELKKFLKTLPDKFDNFGVVNGEYGGLEGEHYYRIDKPIIQITVDEDTEELCILHQSEGEVDNIINTPTKEDEIKDDEGENDK